MEEERSIGTIIFSLAVMALGVLGIASNGGNLGQFGVALAGAVLLLGFCFLVVEVAPR